MQSTASLIANWYLLVIVVVIVVVVIIVVVIVIFVVVIVIDVTKSVHILGKEHAAVGRQDLEHLGSSGACACAPCWLVLGQGGIDVFLRHCRVDTHHM
jgi:hypothetical protein